ncbi:hypothetical protein EYF80_044097 [Liparis tanakae]|uniref:Uncharacterized protein n=1 Tax=Liparis tanakae TaxID=230148 RepID=A0A4Z2FWR5_9TELE|nr:hypothetical protein EYF80_044097 [Liparis tanakae]
MSVSGASSTAPSAWGLSLEALRRTAHPSGSKVSHGPLEAWPVQPMGGCGTPSDSLGCLHGEQSIFASLNKNIGGFTEKSQLNISDAGTAFRTRGDGGWDADASDKSLSSVSRHPSHLVGGLHWQHIFTGVSEPIDLRRRLMETEDFPLMNFRVFFPNDSIHSLFAYVVYYSASRGGTASGVWRIGDGGGRMCCRWKSPGGFGMRR